jgi:hypothetical protein
VVAVKALACELPTSTGVPLARWHCPDLARTAVEHGIVASISGTTIWRWLSADAIKPWQHRSWIFPRDPDFATKAARVLDLYARRFDEAPLGPDEYVISADEKTSIQARIRKHPTTAAASGRPARVEHEYARGGALAYLAAWDVHRAQVFGRCEPTTGNDPFDRLVEQVMTSAPYATARRVFWIVDNGSSHRGQPSIDRLQSRWSTLRLIHLPKHASWLNQVEIYFSVIQRRCLRPTTSTTSTNSKPDCWHSRSTTSRSPHHSNGSSPRPTSKTYSTASPLTKTPNSHQPPNRRQRIRHRNSDPDHLVNRDISPHSTGLDSTAVVAWCGDSTA